MKHVPDVVCELLKNVDYRFARYVHFHFQKHTNIQTWSLSNNRTLCPFFLFLPQWTDPETLKEFYDYSLKTLIFRLLWLVVLHRAVFCCFLKNITCADDKLRRSKLPYLGDVIHWFLYRFWYSPRLMHLWLSRLKKRLKTSMWKRTMPLKRA